MATDQAMRHKELFRALLDGELPDANGRFGPYGGRYVPETLMPAIDRLTDGVYGLFTEETFRNKLKSELKNWVGRPTALTPAPRLSEAWGAEVWFKREDLAHTGAHKITTPSDKRYLPEILVRPGSLRRPVPGSTVLHPRRPAHASVYRAWSTWARSMSLGKHQMSIAWSG